MDPRERGRKGEDEAAAFLQRRGWTILGRNERVGRRELDLIAYRDGVLAFVEVKSRGGTQFGAPLEAVTPQKRLQVFRAASEWLMGRSVPGATVLRFDAVGVTWTGDGRPTVHHVEDAWRLT